MCLRLVVNKCYATCVTLDGEMCTHEILFAVIWTAIGVVVVGSNFGA
jgi:hypothetical protein